MFIEIYFAKSYKSSFSDFAWSLTEEPLVKAVYERLLSKELFTKELFSKSNFIEVASHLAIPEFI